MDQVGRTLTACKGNLRFFFDNKDQLLNSMRTGEVVAAMSWDSIAWKLNRENPDIKFINPKSNAIFWLDTFALPARGRNDAAVYAWINFTMRPDVAAKIAKSIGNFTASQGAAQLMDPRVKAQLAESFAGPHQNAINHIRPYRRAWRRSRAGSSTGSRRLIEPACASRGGGRPRPGGPQGRQALRRARGGRRPVLQRGQGQFLFNTRPIRMRQDHTAANDCRFHRARRRRYCDRRPQHGRRASEPATGQHGVPAVGAVSDDVGRRKCGVRLARRGMARAERSPQGRRQRCSNVWVWVGPGYKLRRRTLGWPAAARCHRPQSGARTDPAPARRAARCPRPEAARAGEDRTQASRSPHGTTFVLHHLRPIGSTAGALGPRRWL